MIFLSLFYPVKKTEKSEKNTKKSVFYLIVILRKKLRLSLERNGNDTDIFMVKRSLPK